MDDSLRQARAARFGSLESVKKISSLMLSIPKGAVSVSPSSRTPPAEQTVQVLVGTSQNLEKPYTRLTTLAESADVRPEPVLRLLFFHILYPLLVMLNSFATVERSRTSSPSGRAVAMPLGH